MSALSIWWQVYALCAVPFLLLRYSYCNQPATHSPYAATYCLQTPQYMLVGMGEIFAAITCYELFYAEVPPGMRSVCQSINLLCTALGSLAAAGVNSVCAKWSPGPGSNPM